MQIKNIIQMNDWKIGEFLKFILIFQITILALIGLDAINIHIPIFREFVTLIYLTFLPGALILRILKLHNLGNIETLLYTVGLSITSLMFIGFLVNMIYPYFGIFNPISVIPLIITMTVFVLILCVLSYMRDKNFSNPSSIDTKDLLSPQFLFLCLIPFLSIFGTYLINISNINLISMILIALIALIALLIAFDKFPRKLYPFTIFIIAISLLYFTSLISMQVWGWDIQHEYYLSDLVMKNSHWDFSFAYIVNAMLSVVMLAPTYSIISNMGLTWVFKIIYPLLFSLVPLGLYRVYEKQTNPKVAFFACFFFVSFNVFFVEMVTLAREEIGELFLILLILLMINKKMVKKNYMVLSILFGFSLITSHYGLTYLYLFALTGSLLILLFLDQNPKTKGIYLDISRKKFVEKLKSLISTDEKINLYLVILFIVFTYIWYSSMASSVVLENLIILVKGASGGLFNKFLTNGSVIGLAQTPTSVITSNQISGFGLLFGKTNTWIDAVNNYLIIIILFLISVGIITWILNRVPAKFKKEYGAFALVNVLILILGLTIPSFASSLNISRIYQFTFIFLAPFCIIGGIKIFSLIMNFFNGSRFNHKKKIAWQAFSIFLVVFMLFNTGFINSLAHITVPIQLGIKSDQPLFNNYESTGALWIGEKKEQGKIYGDLYGQLILIRYLNIQDTEVIFSDSGQMNSDQITERSYIYFRSVNINGKALIYIKDDNSRKLKLINSVKDLTKNRDKIYENGGSEIFIK